MSKIETDDCAHCLGTGEEIRFSPTGKARGRSCKRCKGVGQVETIINEHYLNEEVLDY